MAVQLGYFGFISSFNISTFISLVYSAAFNEGADLIFIQENLFSISNIIEIFKEHNFIQDENILNYHIFNVEQDQLKPNDLGITYW